MRRGPNCILFGGLSHYTPGGTGFRGCLGGGRSMGRPPGTRVRLRRDGRDPEEERFRVEGVRGEVGLHLHRGGCLVLSRLGTWSFRFGGQEILLGPEDLLAIPPGTTHRCGRGEGILEGMRLAPGRWGLWAEGFPPCLSRRPWVRLGWGDALPRTPEELARAAEGAIPLAGCLRGSGVSSFRGKRLRRLWRAGALLLEGASGAEVAALCGYADQSHLIREFRRLWGLTPEQYRGGSQG